MKTQPANDLLNWITAQIKTHRDAANQYAQCYADSDKKEDQAKYREKVRLIAECELFHRQACYFLGQLEELIDTQDKSESTQ